MSDLPAQMPTGDEVLEAFRPHLAGFVDATDDAGDLVVTVIACRRPAGVDGEIPNNAEMEASFNAIAAAGTEAFGEGNVAVWGFQALTEPATSVSGVTTIIDPNPAA